MNYTHSILRDYHPDTGYTIWLLIKFSQCRRVGSDTARRQVVDIFHTMVGRVPVIERPSVGCQATKFWTAGPVTESEAELLKGEGTIQ